MHFLFRIADGVGSSNGAAPGADMGTREGDRPLSPVILAVRGCGISLYFDPEADAPVPVGSGSEGFRRVHAGSMGPDTRETARV